MTTRLQVLAPLLLLAVASVSRAQPPDVPNPISAPQAETPNGQPQQLPLQPIALDDWLKQNGGLARLKFKLDNATAFDIADEVKDQTGIELTTQNLGGGANTQRFSVETMGQPFWEAVSQWNRGDKPDAPKLSLQRDWGNRDRWQLVTWSSIERGRSLQLGPVEFIASSLSRSRSRTQSLLPESDPKINPKAEAPRDSESMSFQASLRIDPKLRPLIMGLIPQFDSITDEKGRAIETQDNYQDPWLDDNSDNLYISMKSPAADARRLRAIKGTMRLAVLTKRERWEVDLEAMPKAEKTFKSAEAEVKVRMDGITRGLSDWTLKMHVERKDIGPPRFFKVNGREYGNSAQLGSYNDIGRAIRVLNSAGETLTSQHSNSRGNEKDGVRITDLEMRVGNDYGGDEGKDIEKKTPAKFVMEVPLEWREIQIPFEFKDLPLP